MGASRFTKGVNHGWKMREVITASATRERPHANGSVNTPIERYLDDMTLSRLVAIAAEGMRGHKA